jgi:hypothetical protein
MDPVNPTIELELPKVRRPGYRAGAALLFTKAPALATPVPFKVRGFADETETPFRSSMAP